MGKRIEVKCVSKQQVGQTRKTQNCAFSTVLVDQAQFWSTRTMLRQCRDLILALSGRPDPLLVDQTSARITPGTGQGSVWSTRIPSGRPDTPDMGEEGFVHVFFWNLWLNATFHSYCLALYDDMYIPSTIQCSWPCFGYARTHTSTCEFLWHEDVAFSSCMSCKHLLYHHYVVWCIYLVISIFRWPVVVGGEATALL
jgi:hypothetical protein